MSKFSLWGAAALLGLLITSSANAHIGYSGRNFGTLVAGQPGTTIAGQTISSSFGWADATDEDWGDSHRGRFFRFNLTGPATVVITVERNDLAAQTGAFDTLLPGFSLFEGLGHLTPFQGAHDSAAFSVASRPPGKEGSFRATENWSIGNDPTYNTPGDPTSGVLYEPSLRNFTFIGYAVDGTSANFGSAPGVVGDGTADGFVTATFYIAQGGDYSLFVGGANYAAQSVETGPTFPTYGVNVTVQAIPEPGTLGLFAAASLGFAVLRRQRKRASL